MIKVKKNKITELFDRFSFHSLVAQRFGKYIIALIAIIIIILIVSIKSQEKVFNENFEESIKFITKVLGESTLDSVVSNDFIFLERLIENLLSNQEDIIYIIILNENNTVLISTIESYISKPIEKLTDKFSKNIKKSEESILRKEKDPFLRNELQKEKQALEQEIIVLKEDLPALENINSYEEVKNKIKQKEQERTEIVNNIYFLSNKLADAEKENNKIIEHLNNKLLKLEDNNQKLLNTVFDLQSLQELYNLVNQKERLINRIPEDNMIYEVSAPIGNNMGLVRVGYSPKRVRKFIYDMYLTSLLIGSLFIIIGIAIAIQLSEERRNLEYMVNQRTKELNESLHRLEGTNLHLQEVLQHKIRFLNTMSHEFRTPLNAIIGFTELLNKQYFGKLNDKQLEYVSLISNGGEHLLELINDILDIAKIDAGSMELNLEQFKAIDFIHEIVSLLNSQFKEKNIQLSYSIEPESIILNADRRKAKQIMLNLLSNALKFTPEYGKVKVLAQIDDNYITISVIDTGCGIKEEEKEKIFSEFYQSDQTRDSALGGTGIGLALTKRLVEMHGGSIGLTSSYGKGSAFWFSIPI